MMPIMRTGGASAGRDSRPMGLLFGGAGDWRGRRASLRRGLPLARGSSAFLLPAWQPFSVDILDVLDQQRQAGLDRCLE